MVDRAAPASRLSQPSRQSEGMTARERVRVRIRSEVARLNPTDDARQALELIAETSLRYAETDGDIKITVVDQNGQPRSTVRNGQVVDFSLRDLVEELRAKHPTLFKGPPDEKLGAVAAWIASAHEADRTEDLDDASADEPTASPKAPMPQARQRDWLHLSSDRERPGGPETWLPAPHDAAEGAPTAPGGRAPRWRGILGRAAAALLLVAIGAAGLALMLAPTEHAAVNRPGEEAPARPADPGATGTVPPPVVPSGATPPGPTPLPSGALPEQSSVAPAAPDDDAAVLHGVPEVMDTATLYLGGKIVPLFGVEWVRGAGNPDDLVQYLHGREVMCRPVAASESYRCEVDGQDLSKVVLYNGGGRATAEATADLKAAETQAQSARVGLWAK